MPRSPGRRLAFLVVALTLLTPWSAQALPLDRPPSAPLADLSARLTDWFMSLLGDIGCSWDPDGWCRDASASNPDIGCSADPSGWCRDSVDIGCSMDPSGHCRDDLEVGCSLDPSGRCGERLDIGCSWDPNGSSCPGRD